MQKVSILFIAPKCYQLSSPEAIVNSKLVNAFRKAGHRVVVVSQYREEDQSAGNMIDEEDVFPVQVPRGNSLKGLLLHLLMFLRYGYCYRTIHWAHPAIRRCKKLIREVQFDFILSRSQPSEVVASVLSSKYYIPWLANWNDPYPLENYPPPYGKGAENTIPAPQRRVLERMAKQAACFTFPNKRLQHYMNRYFPADLIKKGAVFPHILAVKDSIPESTQSDKLLIQHSGRLWYPRDPYPFLRAVRELIDRYHISSDEFELEFIGNQDVGLHEMIREQELESYISVSKSVSYKDSLKMMESISFGLVIEADLREGIFFPSKVVDYFQMRKPVFAISPAEGVMKDLSQTTNSVVHTNNQNIDSIVAALYTIFKAWKSDPALMEFSVSDELLAEYSDEKAVHNYENLFMEILGQNE